MTGNDHVVYQIGEHSVQVSSDLHACYAKLRFDQHEFTLRMAHGETLPSVRRWHYSMAIAEPVIPRPLLLALVEAINLHRMARAFPNQGGLEPRSAEGTQT